MELKKAIENEYHDDVINEVDKLLQEDKHKELFEQLNIIKLVALVKANKLQRAENFFKTKYEKEEDKYFKMIQYYLLYQKSHYDKLLNIFYQLKDQPKSIEENLLHALVLSKKEKYLQAFEIYHNVYQNQKIDKNDLSEEITINLLNTAILSILQENTQQLKKNTTFIEQLKIILKELINQKLKNWELRESFMNFLLLLIVIDQNKIFSLDQFLGNNFDFVKQGEELISKIEEDIQLENQNKENEMEEETEQEQVLTKFQNLSGEKLNDYLTLFILRTFLMKKEQQINWKKEEMDQLEILVLEKPNEIKDQQLRISLLSYLIFIHTISQASVEKLNQLYQRTIEELAIMKKTKKHFKYLENMLCFNQIILNLHLRKTHQAKKLLQTLDYQHQEFDLKFLPVELVFYIKQKNYKKFQEKLNQIQSVSKNSKENQCITFLFQLSFYNNINNQKKYAKIFTQFLNEFFIPELNKPADQRFLKTKVFTQFAQTIVFYILKNNNILNNLREQIINFVEYINDVQTIARIAERFLLKNELQVAQNIYEVLVQKNPDNMFFVSRLNYIYSILDPEKIKEENLPEFDTIKDFNTLNNLENDFLGQIQNSKNNTNLLEKKDQKPKAKKIVKRKKKKRIRWPKNFDFNNPGSRPDPERWIPKYEREKYRKIALKKGQLTRTQGLTVNPDMKQEYKKVYSTANQKTRKRKKGRKKQ